MSLCYPFLVPRTVAVTGFNSGVSQVNFNFLQLGGDYPFINLLKTAQFWLFIDNSGTPTPDLLNTDGYPTSIVHSGVYTVFYVPEQSARSGNYVATWDGNGTIFCGMNNTLVSGSKTSSGGSGRYVFSTEDSRFVVGISALGSPIITNLCIMHIDDEADYNSGAVFGTKFKQRLAQANFGVYRFLNWTVGNTTNVTTWATRKPMTYVFYDGYEARSSIYAGTTTNSGNNYSITLGGFSLVDKAQITVVFNVSATTSGTCSLNVSGTGAKNILSEYSTALSVGGNSYPVGDLMATLIYDADLNAWIKQGGDAAIGNSGLTNGAPPELMVRLCGEMGAHPHFVAPPLAVDPMTDYFTELATLVKNSAYASWMIPRFEGCNELWNTAGGFYQTNYAIAKATAHWGTNNYHEWYGKTLSTIGQAVSAVYANDRTKYQVLCGVQTVLAGDSGNNPRLTAAEYVAQAAAPQTGYTKSAATGWTTHVCCAQYYAPDDYGTGTEVTLAAAYAGGDLTAPATYIDSIPGALTFWADAYAGWKTWAQGFGITKMCGYEGGYSPDLTNSADLDNLRLAGGQVASSPGSATGLQGYTITNYNNFVGLTGGGFTAEFPSCFQFSGWLPVHGGQNIWSVLVDIYQTPDPPQWNAIVQFNG